MDEPATTSRGLAGAIGIGSEHHPLRELVLSEVHARPFEILSPPLRVSHIAMITGPDGALVEAEREALVSLCLRFGVPRPADTASHYSADFGAFRLRWERHQEFSTYTFIRPGRAPTPFADPAIAVVPQDWLALLPGQLLGAVHLVLEPNAGDAAAPQLEQLFDADVLAGSQVGRGTALAWTDFRAHGDGFTRILVQDQGLAPRRAGRLVQRLLEIETYRLMALLAFPVARKAGPELARLEQALERLIERMTEISGLEGEQALLAELTELAAQVERISARTSFRLSAANAYYELVKQRIDNLLEQRVGDLQTLGKFMERRLRPAMRTCESVAARQDALARRIARAANLLRTRVDVALEAQNRDLLASMNRRTDLQLRLQQTVEGLSVVVLSYYAVGLIGYLAKAAKSAGAPLAIDLTMGIAVPVVIGVVWIMSRVLRRRLHRS